MKDQANAVNAQAEAARYTALLEAGVVSKESQQAQVSTAGQAQGSIDADKAAIRGGKGEPGLYEDYVADQWRGWFAAGGSGQYRACRGYDRAAGGDAVAADRGDLYAAGGSVCPRC